MIIIFMTSDGSYATAATQMFQDQQTWANGTDLMCLNLLEWPGNGNKMDHEEPELHPQADHNYLEVRKSSYYKIKI